MTMEDLLHHQHKTNDLAGMLLQLGGAYVLAAIL